MIIEQLGPNVGGVQYARMTCTASSVTSAENEWGKGHFPAVCKSSNGWKQQICWVLFLGIVQELMETTRRHRMSTTYGA